MMNALLNPQQLLIFGAGQFEQIAGMIVGTIFLIAILTFGICHALGVTRWQEAAKLKEQQAAKRLRDNQTLTFWAEQYEERKKAIGIVACPQCQWEGEWGTGMSFKQFFAGDLYEAGIRVSRAELRLDNLSHDNRQYTCPQCNSTDWKKI